MHKLFVDVNVILDVASMREPHHESSRNLLALIEQKKAHGFSSALSYVTVYYLLSKKISPEQAKSYVKSLMRLLPTVQVNHQTLERSLEMQSIDFEHNVQIACAEQIKADFIITRDASGYKTSSIKALTPAEYLATFF